MNCGTLGLNEKRKDLNSAEFNFKPPTYLVHLSPFLTLVQFVTVPKECNSTTSWASTLTFSLDCLSAMFQDFAEVARLLA